VNLYVFEFLFLVIVFLLIALFVHLHRANRPRWSVRRNDTCCFTRPCSARCAQLRDNLILAGTIEGVRASEGYRAVVRQAEAHSLYAHQPTAVEMPPHRGTPAA
jgi:hypothetical protein